MRITSFVAMAATALSFVVAPVAQAADPNLCPILRSVMDASIRHFKDIRDKKTDSKEWSATSRLAYAGSCHIDADYLDGEVRYKCFFYPKGTGNAAMWSAAQDYAANIQACRSELTMSSNGTDTIDLYSDKFVRIRLTSFSDFFNVIVFEPERENYRGQ